MYDLAMGYGIHMKTVVVVPNDVEDILLQLLDNLLIALEVREGCFLTYQSFTVIHMTHLSIESRTTV